jgi:ubiquinol-cytochrome c reductase cytochrome b subunit
MSKPRGKSAEVINLDLVSKDLASQRLHAENLFPYLVGLIEGDGWFTVSKNGMYLTYEIGIELSIRDIQLLYKIKKWLKVGIVGIKKGKNGLSDKAFFRIRNKSHLTNIILPIFDKYPILSNKQYDYLRVRSELLANTIYSKDLKKYKRPTEYINSVNTVLNTPYFKSWLIGFIEAEGCFSIYKPTNDTSKVASFDIAQTDGCYLITAIGVFLSFSQKPFKDKTNCFKLKVSNVRSVENIVKFIQSAPIKLQGYKRLSYLIWVKELRNIPRYSTRFKIPTKY